MAANDKGKSYYGLGIDNSQLLADANRSSNILKGIGDKAVAEGARIDNAFRRVATGLGSVFVFQQASQFISQIARVRGEFQQLEVAFETMLKSKSKADALMSQLVRTAAVTPFGLQDVAQGAKQLLAYGEASETINDTLVRLGNIASGLSIPLNDLVYLYGTTMVQGRLFTQDIRQFQGRGIPLVQELAKEFGKTTDEINKMVTAGKIGFPEVQKVIQNLTNAGGTFYNLMEKQSKTITGQISNLGDAWDTMLNKIGQSSEGVISKAISGATNLIENYEAVGREIMALVTAYGAYKAALITITAIEKQRLVFNKLVAEFILLETALRKGATAAMIQEAAAERALNTMKQNLIASTKALSKALLSNPYVLVAASVAALVYVIYKLITAETAAEAAQRKHNEAMEAAKEKRENLISKIQQLTNKINDETQAISAQIKAWKELQKEMPEAFGKMTILEFKNMKPEERDKLINKTAEERDISELNKSIEDAQRRVNSLETLIAEANKTGDAASASMNNYRIRQLEEARETLRILQEQKKEQDEILKQAEFMSKPDAEKLAILNKQLKAYEEQRSEIEKIELKGVQNINTEWGKLDFYTGENEANLNALNSKISETKGLIDAINKANGGGGTYAEAIENARKTYIDAKKLVDDITKNSKDYSPKAYEDAVKKLDEAKQNYKDLGGDVSTSKKTRTPQKDYTEQIEREKQEKIRFYKDTEFAVRQAKIDADEDGLEKVLAQNKLNFEKEIEQLRQQKEDKLTRIQEWERTIWESEHPNWEEKGMKFIPKTTRPSDEDKEQDKTIETGIKARFTADNKKAYEEDLNDYAQFSQKYLDKVDEFKKNLEILVEEQKKKREELVKSGASEDDLKDFDSRAESTIKGVKAMQAEILAGLDEEMEIKEQTFVTFVEGMVGMGLEQLLEALNQAKDALETEISSGGDDKYKVNQLKAKVKTLTARINELTAVKDDTKEVKAGDPAKKWKDTLAVMQDVKSLTNNISNSFEGLDDATKAVLDAATNIATGVINMIIGINTLAVSSAAATTMTATTAAEAIKGVERASVILAIISAALQIAQAIASVITNIFSGDKKKEKEIQRLQEQVDVLKESYDKLEEAIDKAYSTNAANLIKQNDDNLRLQKKFLEEQLRLEEDKKKTDEGAVRQYKEAIKAIDNELESTHDKVIEAMTGKDVSSAIDEFAEAYMDAWSAGEDKAASMKDVVRKMVKSAITELVKSRMSKEVGAFMDYLAAAMEDGILTVAEQNTLDALDAAIYNKLNGLDANLEKYVKDKNEDERQASQKGFASMSQDSADELNGRFTAIQAHTYVITENTKILVANSTRILQHLAGIESNTEACRRLDGMDEDLKTIKNSVNDIVLKGITVKKQG
jgi:tape measure domain-containing protein